MTKLCEAPKSSLTPAKRQSIIRFNHLVLFAPVPPGPPTALGLLVLTTIILWSSGPLLSHYGSLTAFAAPVTNRWLGPKTICSRVKLCFCTGDEVSGICQGTTEAVLFAVRVCTCFRGNFLAPISGLSENDFKSVVRIDTPGYFPSMGARALEGIAVPYPQAVPDPGNDSLLKPSSEADAVLEIITGRRVEMQLLNGVGTTELNVLFVQFFCDPDLR
ncbi:hypothetical protein BDP27DRAFT_1412244 [Rhodocollybia butyracea]|uniref:Uncharacterized protein n=1 Tax=Rhodocollybia butyracea TaxID=206335 RepID=A0A9P5P323_9AGAR|nr:hypothetical protein BDP27DRAFT_1412244 [Rhodocollybia butyracea]